MKPSNTRLGSRPAADVAAGPGGRIGNSAAAPVLTRQTGEARRRALVIEADPGTRKAFQGVLTRCGMVADMVDNGVAAVGRARRKAPDVIIVDMQLRDSPGLEVVQWLRSNPALRWTPVIVLTTNANDLSRSKSWSVDAVLLKPVASEVMESAIRDVIDLENT
jgi:CheY-like chemotaxis protein